MNTLTSATDHQAHDVTDTELDRSVHAGICQAVCGHTVVVTALVTPLGTTCPQCVERRPAERHLAGPRAP